MQDAAHAPNTISSSTGRIISIRVISPPIRPRRQAWRSSTGAVGRFDGSVTVLKPYEDRCRGHPNPSYRDLFPEPPPPGTRAELPPKPASWARSPASSGTLQAMEAIKLVTGIGEPLVGPSAALRCARARVRHDPLSARHALRTPWRRFASAPASIVTRSSVADRASFAYMDGRIDPPSSPMR